MKIISKILMLVFFALFISCGNNEEPSITEREIIKVTEKNEIKKVEVIDLHATLGDNEKKGRYLKFNLAEARMTDGDDWDIAFYHRSIIFNGGEYVMLDPYNIGGEEIKRTGNAGVVIMGKTDAKDEAKKENLVVFAKETDGDYLKLKEVPENIEFVQDKLNHFAIDDDSKGMYEYYLSPVEHIVTVKKNRFLLIRTHNGHYAKLKIQSNYKGAGETADASLETGSMDEGIKYANYITFTYKYNTKKGDKRLE